MVVTVLIVLVVLLCLAVAFLMWWCRELEAGLMAIRDELPVQDPPTGADRFPDWRRALERNKPTGGRP